MSLGWAIVAIIGALILGMAIGAVVGETVRKAPEPARQAVPEAEVPGAAEAVESAAVDTRIRSRRAGKRRADVPVDGPSTVEPTLELMQVDLPPEPAPKAAARSSDYVITSIGQPEAEPAGRERKEFELRPQLEGAARTALIEVSSALHGLRNALTEENRAKIQYEIKRELIRVRKTRKLEVKQALREFRARRDQLDASDLGEDA